VFSWSFIHFYFRLVSLSLSTATCLLIWFSCTNTACLSSRTLSPTLTLVHPCRHQGPVHTPLICVCLNLHNRRSPTYFDRACRFCVRSCDWIARACAYSTTVGAFLLHLLLHPSCRFQVACHRNSHRNQAPTSTQSSAMVRRRAICAYINRASTLLPTGAPRPLSRREENQTARDLS
jgi:hypothetical protein